MIMKESSKKQIPLRLSESLYNELVRWADDDFRSVNGQIEFLLTECIKKRKKNFSSSDKENKDNLQHKWRTTNNPYKCVYNVTNRTEFAH